MATPSFHQMHPESRPNLNDHSAAARVVRRVLLRLAMAATAKLRASQEVSLLMAMDRKGRSW